MILKSFRCDGLAQLSYLVADEGLAAVIDPCRDFQPYLEAARQEGVRITHVIETHSHEDFVSGGPGLARAAGALLCHGPRQGGPGQALEDGAHLAIGNLCLTVLTTPGHSPDAISLVLEDRAFRDGAIAVFTGDTLLTGAVGRTDLGPDEPDQAGAMLYRSLFDKLLPLGDELLLYPGHGAGEITGGPVQPQLISTLGRERRHNPLLQLDQPAFLREHRRLHPEKPRHYRHLRALNRRGAPVQEHLPEPQPLDMAQFQRAAAEDGVLCLDVRDTPAFAAAHLPGSLHIPLELLAGYAGWLLPYDRPLGLVAGSARERDTARRTLARLGYDRISCFLAGDGDELAGSTPEGSLRQLDGPRLRQRLAGQDCIVLDVRSSTDYAAAHLQDALHVPLSALDGGLTALPHDRTLVVFGSDTRRAAMAASWLHHAGLRDVAICQDSLTQCAASGCPVSSTSQAA